MSEDSKLRLRQFANDSSYNFIRQALSIVLGMAVSVLLARGLGTSARGVYALAILFPNLLMTFSNLGVGPATVYFVGRESFDDETVVQNNLILSISISFVGISTGLLIAWFGGANLFPTVDLHLLFIALLLIPATLANGFLLGYLQGKQNFRLFNLIGIVPQGTMLILLLVFVWWQQRGVQGALAANIASVWVTLLLALILLRDLMPASLVRLLHLNKTYVRDVLTYGLKSHVSNMIAFLNYRSDMLLLGLFLPAGAVGIYAIAVGLVERLWILSSSLSTTIFPRIASMGDQEEERRLLTTLVTRHVLWVSVLLGGFLAVVANWLVILLYTAEYAESVFALQMLIPGVVLLSGSKVLANDIAGRGKPLLNSIHSFIAFVINVSANLILIPVWGVTGAAASTTISYSLLATMKLFAYCQIAEVEWQDVLFLKQDDFLRLWALVEKLSLRKRVLS